MKMMLTPSEITLNFSPSIFYPTYYSKARRIVHQGGQWSGKTVNILMVLAKHAQENTSKQLGYGDEVITVTSQSLPHLRSGALRDFERFVYPAFKAFIKQYNKTDHIFYFKNGSIIEFKSYEDEFKARGAKRTRLFINEANGYDYMTYFQLDSRTDIQTILDYNPTAKFWVHDQLIGEEGTELFISDHRHNPFLSEDKHREIESIKDPELWKVYARGKTGNTTGIIYPNWTIINDEDFPTNNDHYFYGMDFGYENDPTVIVMMTRINRNIYIKEIAYKTGDIPPRHVIELLKSSGWRPEYTVYTDRDPNQVRQLALLGIRVIPANKQPGSIQAGIQKVKEYNIFYTHSSANIKEELKRYIWEISKETGKPTNTPKQGWDHAMDAIRYGIYTHFYRDQRE